MMDKTIALLDTRAQVHEINVRDVDSYAPHTDGCEILLKNRRGIINAVNRYAENTVFEDSSGKRENLPSISSLMGIKRTSG